MKRHYLDGCNSTERSGHVACDCAWRALTVAREWARRWKERAHDLRRAAAHNAALAADYHVEAVLARGHARVLAARDRFPSQPAAETSIAPVPPADEAPGEPIASASSPPASTGGHNRNQEG